MNLQQEQMKMLEMLKKRETDFQRERLEKQLEVEATKKEKDREFFLEFGKILKNAK